MPLDALAHVRLVGLVLPDLDQRGAVGALMQVLDKLGGLVLRTRCSVVHHNHHVGLAEIDWSERLEPLLPRRVPYVDVPLLGSLDLVERGVCKFDLFAATHNVHLAKRGADGGPHFRLGRAAALQALNQRCLAHTVQPGKDDS